ncbi:MAG: Xaa-Pro peptidase family protein [Mariprofundales bacterium]|nr:Xaa-Pro peptidase family protein [Mariprofundales bacterium]
MQPCRLMIADSEHNADMLYVSAIFIPDAWIAISIEDRWHGILSPLEFNRAQKMSRLHKVWLDSEWQQRAHERYGKGSGLAGTAAAFLDAHHIDSVEVPRNFSHAIACQLQQYGIAVTPSAGEFLPQRACKRDDEIAELATAERLTARSMKQALNFLADCSIGEDGILRHRDFGHKKLRVQVLRSVIEQWLIGHGAIPSHTIVACGRQGADPHNEGSGWLHGNRPIIIDIFPRLTRSGYWGDMTRTVVKGRATPQVRAMHKAVADAQKCGLNAIRHGVAASHIHNTVRNRLKQHGFFTGVRGGKQVGFFHGTGHGVGLEVHEPPRLSSADNLLQSGEVVTVEPGLYYPAIGGVRIEDMVVVTVDGCRNLTNFHRRLEIP